MKNVVLDAHALLKFYQDETGANKVEKLLISSRSGHLDVYVSEINLGEVYYMMIRRLGLSMARVQIEQFSELPIQIISPSTDIIMYAAETKAEYAISYADCFAVATALKVKASVVTGDPEFKKVEHIVKIQWL